MSAPLCTVTPLEALRRLYDVARKVDAKEAGEFETLLQGELAVAEAALREAAPAAPTCESCGTHEVELFKLCHNSRCAQYAVQQSVYQGWAKVPAAAPVVPVAAQPVVPEGWQLVPIEPTIAMIAALGWAGDEALAMGHAMISSGIADEYAAMLAADPSLEAQPAGEVDREKLIDALAQSLTGSYDCMRVWSAWGVGTMGEEDFNPISDDRHRLEEIADELITAMAQGDKA